MTTSNGEGAARASAAGHESAPGPGTRNRPGQAAAGEPGPSFLKVLWENPREPALVGLGGVLPLGWGVSTAVADGPVLGRVLGAVAAVAGTLLLISYTLRFFPAILRRERWFSTRPQRAMRLALRNAWRVFLGAALLAGVMSLFVDL